MVQKVKGKLSLWKNRCRNVKKEKRYSREGVGG